MSHRRRSWKSCNLGQTSPIARKHPEILRCIVSANPRWVAALDPRRCRARDGVVNIEIVKPQNPGLARPGTIENRGISIDFMAQINGGDRDIAVEPAEEETA